MSALLYNAVYLCDFAAGPVVGIAISAGIRSKEGKRRMNCEYV